MKDAVSAAAVVRLVHFEELDWFRNLNTPEEFRGFTAARG